MSTSRAKTSRTGILTVIRCMRVTKCKCPHRAWTTALTGLAQQPSLGLHNSSHRAWTTALTGLAQLPSLGLHNCRHWAGTTALTGLGQLPSLGLHNCPHWAWTTALTGLGQLPSLGLGNWPGHYVQTRRVVSSTLLTALVVHSQGDLLESLQHVKHIPRLLGRGTLFYKGRDWHCVLVSPFCQLLSCDDSLKLFAQVSDNMTSQGLHN